MQDLTGAKESPVAYVQQKAFGDKVIGLRMGQAVRVVDYKLDPILHDGILSVGGRLSKLAMLKDVTHLAILPNIDH